MSRKLVFVILVSLSNISLVAAQTSVVLLGTGTPFADPDKSGPAVAVIVNGKPYIFDSGPGVVRMAAKAYNKGVKPLAVENLDKVFITHLHSDHTLGLADIYLSPAVLGRQGPLNVYGPKGIAHTMNQIRDAYKEDIALRTEGLEHGHKPAYELKVKEIDSAFKFADENVTIEAIPVSHGSWKFAYGYKITTHDKKVIVISGDCTYSESIVKASKNADVLVHEVYSVEGLAQRTAEWQKYHSTFHTSSKQLAAIANSAKPRKLILIHQLVWKSSEEKLMQELQEDYKGVVINGKDLDVIAVD